MSTGPRSGVSMSALLYFVGHAARVEDVLFQKVLGFGGVGKDGSRDVSETSLTTFQSTKFDLGSDTSYIISSRYLLAFALSLPATHRLIQGTAIEIFSSSV